MIKEHGLTTLSKEGPHHDPFPQELLVTMAPSTLHRRNLKTQFYFSGFAYCPYSSVTKTDLRFSLEGKHSKKDCF